MVVDAGEFVDYVPAKYSRVAARPDSATRPTEVYARYIRHFLPKQSGGKLDYGMVSHYHMDHFGRVEDWMRADDTRGYVFTGITALAARIPIRTLIDRSWPDYSGQDSKAMGRIDFYKAFVEYACAHEGMKAMRFEPGRDDQIVLCHDQERYRSFRLTAYAASGKVWDGERIIDPYKGKPFRENGGSCCFLLSYGRFDYYSGGDAGGNTKVALPVARAIGRRIEAMKADHHLSINTMKDETMDILRPEVIVTQSFFQRDGQPHLPTVERLLKRSPAPLLFFTNISPSTAAVHPDIYGKTAGMNGHIVIRVMPGGKKYYVFMLDDGDFSYRVKSIHGPFRSKR